LTSNVFRALGRALALSGVVLLGLAAPVLAENSEYDLAAPGSAENTEYAATFYIAKMSGEEGWEDVFVNPMFSEYVDTYVAVAALSGPYAHFRNDRLSLEAEGQIAYNWGGQEHWELNVVPLMPRWRWFPRDGALESSVAFGIGLSYATHVPEVEVELEGESNNLLVYWVAELTTGPFDAPWSVSLRLHHRSVAYGMFGKDGGMNGVGLGLRYGF
jgi:hypothetical protein